MPLSGYKSRCKFRDLAAPEQSGFSGAFAVYDVRADEILDFFSVRWVFDSTTDLFHFVGAAPHPHLPCTAVAYLYAIIVYPIHRGLFQEFEERLSLIRFDVNYLAGADYTVSVQLFDNQDVLVPLYGYFLSNRIIRAA